MRRVISLNDSNWTLGSVAQKPFGVVDDLAEVTEWLPAQVPGDVRLDLLRASRIPDPFYGTNNDASQWVDSRDWWYVRELENLLEAAREKGERAFLVLDGVDYQSAVWLDGKPLGQHTGMFSRQVYEISGQGTVSSGHKPVGSGQWSVASPHGVNRSGRLAIRVWGSDALPKLRLSAARKLMSRVIRPLFSPPSEPYPDRYATVKCQMSFGWDFAPRLRTCGIWDDASVVVVRSAFIKDAWVKTEEIDGQGGSARLKIVLTVDSDRDRAVRCLVTVQASQGATEPQSASSELQLHAGEQQYTVGIDVDEPRRWNPWDRGEPNLYMAHVELEDAQGVLDAHDAAFGIRSFHLAAVAGAPSGAEPWSFVVNGQGEFIRGANWVPLDAIPGRLTRADYRARLEQVRAANVNFLRVWGGGLREKQAFYDLCDELGILVWQEFPFSGAILDRFPSDPASLALAHQEASAIVRALRNHPSLVVWCGGNEFNTRGNRAVVRSLEQAVLEADGTRPFKPASPFRDESHNWRVWHRKANLQDYRLDRTPFLSEFGLQSPPDVESLKRFLPEDKVFPPNELWTYHRAEIGKLERYAYALNPEIHTLDEFVAASQRAQSLGLQIAIEHMRRGKPRTAGVAVWQFDEPWPAISWSVVDYYGRPKRAYAELQRLYNPLLASFDYPVEPRSAGAPVHGELWIINDWLRSFKLELRVLLNGQEHTSRSIHIGPDSATHLGPLSLPRVDGVNLLRLELREDGQLLSDNEYELELSDCGNISPLVAWAIGLYNRMMQ